MSVARWVTHVPRPVAYLAAGVPGAILLNVVCCGMLGWGLGAPAHELGHAIAGWLMGYPSVPLPVLTIHAGRSFGAFVLAWAAVGAIVAWRRPAPAFLAALGALAAALWLVALRPVHEVFCLWAGHGGEVAFAAAFFYLTLRGGFDWEKAHERPIYATLAWSAWFNNVNLFRKLITDPAAQYVYHVQSFLMQDGTNDYSRIATYFGTSVPRAAVVGLATSLLIPPLGVLAWWLAHREALWEDPVELPAWARRGRGGGGP